MFPASRSGTSKISASPATELTFLADADAAGIVLGARVPIILTSRADNVRSRVASCAVAALYAHARRVAVLGIGKLTD